MLLEKGERKKAGESGCWISVVQNCRAREEGLLVVAEANNKEMGLWKDIYAGNSWSALVFLKHIDEYIAAPECLPNY